ncbi:MAG: hypothetical protein GWN58_16495, partial [Anaerolineae bacterium]|nr:hypothetical protein [Anaerolineae bacterium]
SDGSNLNPVTMQQHFRNKLTSGAGILQRALLCLAILPVSLASVAQTDNVTLPDMG